MFGFNVFDSMNRHGQFKTQYRCYSVSMLPGQERDDVDRGGKIIMPPSALDKLTRLNIVYPMLFKLTNTSNRMDRETHCGVLEFVADEGKIYLPYWMMHNLLLEEEGSLVTVESVSLPVATYSKFQPLSVDFLDITNPKAVLENCLRNFACLSTGDIVGIKYNDKVYELSVLETKPGKAVSIIECDMSVEFAAPIGYKEPNYRQQNVEEEMAVDSVPEDQPDDSQFIAFKGSGHRLDGKKKGTEGKSPVNHANSIKRGIPNYDYKMGKLTFIRNSKHSDKNHIEESDKPDSFAAFSGQGHTVRKKMSRKP